MVTLLIAVTLQAQENVPQIKRHDFRIDIGAKITSPGYSFYHDCSQIDAPTTLPENMQYTYIPTSPSINLSYYYQFKKWFAFGFTGTYARGGEYREGLITNRLYSSTIWNQFAVTPRVRFDWFRNNIVNCYSSVGIGVSYVYESRKTNYEQSYTNDS